MIKIDTIKIEEFHGIRDLTLDLMEEITLYANQTGQVRVEWLMLSSSLLRGIYRVCLARVWVTCL